MPGLRVLRMPNWSFDADDFTHLQNLLWLEELDLSQASSRIQLKCLPASLRLLNVRATSIRELPHMPNLEALDVSNCYQWLGVPRCPKLRSLNMTGNSAEVLDFRHLLELQELDVSNCEMSHLLVGPQLRVLIAEQCSCLLEIPDLPNLLELNVMFCERLVVLPQLPALMKLKNCATATRPNRSMGQLREFDANALVSNEPQCLDLVPLVENLELQGCEFSNGDFLARLTNLTWLILKFNTPPNLQFASSLTKLTRLRLYGDISDSDLAPLVTLKTLKSLEVTSDAMTDAGLISIAQIRGLAHLSIDTNRCRDLSCLGLSVDLRHLELVSCAIDDLSVMSTIVNLEILCIWSNRTPLDLEPLAKSQSLTKLKIHGCDVRTLRGLNQIPRLAELAITTCRLHHLYCRPCQESLDLLPQQLTTLTFKLVSAPHDGRKWKQLLKQFRASNPWVEINT
jgi:Leucine-rich repeat (LRR) protein